MKPRAAMLVAFVVLGSLQAAGGAAALPAAPVFPQVLVSVAPVAPVDVNRDSEANITTNGTVNITVPAFVTVETHIYFNVTVNNTYWPATISPRSAVVTGSALIPFTVNVTVPGRVSVDAGAAIYVDANVSVAPGFGKSFTDETAIPIIQYFGLAMTPRTSTSAENFTVTAGADTGFSLRLQNLGNGRDSFELRVDNLADLQARGMTVTLPSPISVPAKVTVNVNGNITVPATLTTGNFTISVTGLSTGAAAKGDTVTASTAKLFAVVPPEPGGGNGGGGGGGGNVTSGKGFLPGFEGPAAGLSLAGVAALAAAHRRIRRP